MHNSIYRTILTICGLLLLPALSPAQGESFILRGRVYDASSHAPVAGASISLADGTISTVTNSHGEYRLIIPHPYAKQAAIRISHIGYQGAIKPLELTGTTLSIQVDIPLEQEMRKVAPVVVTGGNALPIVTKALARIKANYPNQEEALVAFYRESIRRGGNYVSLVEAILGINKASYSSPRADQARLHVGRRGTDLKPQDTIALQYQGGITSALLLDVAKNPLMLFDDMAHAFRFLLTGSATIDGHPHYIVHFEPSTREFSELQYAGKLHIDTATYAVRSIRFSLLIENGSPAARVIVRRAPLKVRVYDIKADYEVEYRADNGVSRLAYCKIDLGFTCKKRYSLFSRAYSIRSEMAITGRSSQAPLPIARPERIRSTDVIAQRVEAFEDPNFWEGYTTIEPDESIRAAISKLARRMKRF